MARKNPRRGHQKVQDELLKPGHRIDATTIPRILKRHPIPPAPVRHTDTNRQQFPRTHATSTSAADFVHLDCALTLQPPYVLLALEDGNRYLHALGMTGHPDRP
jgi:putative transposase